MFVHVVHKVDDSVHPVRERQGDVLDLTDDSIDGRFTEVYLVVVVSEFGGFSHGTVEVDRKLTDSLKLNLDQIVLLSFNGTVNRWLRH